MDTQTLLTILLIVVPVLGGAIGWQVTQIFELRTKFAGLEARHDSAADENNRRFDEIRDELKVISGKLDRALDRQRGE